MRKFNLLYDEALAETETIRNNIINQAYIDRLEKRVIELEDAQEKKVTQEQVNTLMNSLPHEMITIFRIKVARAAYNLPLKEAQDMVEVWDRDVKLPF
jgi:ribosomal protein L7/L12